MDSNIEWIDRLINEQISQIVTNLGQHSKHYTFGKFDDNLTENLLKYLPLKDKIIFRSVNKQFNKCLFNKQYVLTIHWLKITSTQLNNCFNSMVLNDIRMALKLLIKMVWNAF